LALSDHFVSNFSLSSLKLKYGAWSNGASEFCGFLLLPVRGTEARTSFLLETSNALAPEFNTAAGAEAQSSALNKSKQYLLILALSRKQ
jgi:hypothetical protein